MDYDGAPKWIRTTGLCLRRATALASGVVFPPISSRKSQEHRTNIEAFAVPVRSQIGGAA